MPRQPNNSYVNSAEYKEKMSREISKHLAGMEQKYGNIKTTLSFEELLSKQKRKRYGDGVGRPQNAFVIYRKDVQARFNSEGKKLDLASMSRAASALWANEAADTKKLFSELADISATIHEAIFPDYEFHPKNKAKKASKRRHERNIACRSPVPSNPPVVYDNVVNVVTPEFPAQGRNTTNDHVLPTHNAYYYQVLPTTNYQVLPTGFDENFGAVSLGENQWAADNLYYYVTDNSYGITHVGESWYTYFNPTNYEEYDTGF
jgi:hypothetical protein